MRKILVVVLCFTLALGLAGCGGDIEELDTKINVGTWKTAQTIQPFFYQDYLKDPIEVLPFTNPGDMKAALLADSLDMCGTTIVTAITAASKGEPVVLVSGLSNKCSALVVAKDSDINTAKDLKGKRIAYVPGTMHHLLLLEVLSNNGINPEEDVELIRIDFFDMGQALAQGTIDAFYSGEPYPSIAVAEGYGKILLYPDDNEGFGIINSAMMTTKDKIKNNPKVIQKLVMAHMKATEHLKKDREAWLNKAYEFGTDREVLYVSADNIELFWDIDDHYIESVKNLAQRMFEQGLITEVPDVNEIFDLRFIKNAEKELHNEK
ncbi:MAG: ABC transporter substrate-binding protein [Epulopiscium sp.]|nr:ABC transporter substrate-binding protein [Candidatus Epulonipiscium sp.]